jgi:hypothetical protein
VLHLLGVDALTRHLGSAAGGPRAVVLGALVLLAVLVLSASTFIRVRADPGAGRQDDGRSAIQVREGR